MREWPVTDKIFYEQVEDGIVRRRNGGPHTRRATLGEVQLAGQSPDSLRGHVPQAVSGGVIS